MSIRNPLEIVATLAAEFATTAVERDKNGGTPKHERDRLRESGLLKIAIPKIYGGYSNPK
jgi:alkylation response protein AidB-like acyl-CoA dehydrogenase